MQSNGHKSLVKMLVMSSKIINDTLGLVGRVMSRRQQIDQGSATQLSAAKSRDEAEMRVVKEQLEVAKERVDALMQRMSFEKAPSQEQISLGMGLGAGSSIGAADGEQGGEDDGRQQ